MGMVLAGNPDTIYKQDRQASRTSAATVTLLMIGGQFQRARDDDLPAVIPAKGTAPLQHNARVKTFKIRRRFPATAVGNEVVPEGIRAVDAAGALRLALEAALPRGAQTIGRRAQ